MAGQEKGVPNPKHSRVQHMETWQTLLFCTSMHPVGLVTSILTKRVFPAPFERMSTTHAKQAQTIDFPSADLFFCLQNQISLLLHYDSSMNISPFKKWFGIKYLYDSVVENDETGEMKDTQQLEKCDSNFTVFHL